MLFSILAAAQVVIRGGQHEDSKIPQQSDGEEQIRQQIIRESIGAYLATGRTCACPYNIARDGSNCGARSAYARPGGAAPLCYPSDVSNQMVADWKPGYYGAIAWDMETGKYGVSWNKATAERAAEAAVSDCGATGCKVIIRTRPAMCAALATNESGKYAGGAARKDRDAARLAALNDCQKGNAGECTVRVTDCNN
jgi:hypothetical protein